MFTASGRLLRPAKPSPPKLSNFENAISRSREDTGTCCFSRGTKDRLRGVIIRTSSRRPHLRL